MRLVICIFVIVLLIIDFASTQSCRSFNNTYMQFQDRKGNQFGQEINGCITRTIFVNTTVVSANVTNQIVPKLGKDSVRHMKYLTTVSFKNSSVEEILPVAFRNVPNLLKIEITFNKLKKIPKGIFNFEFIPRLELLKIDHNQIASIEDEAFVSLSNLKNLQLSFNNLQSFRTNWFENTTSLEIIDVSYNNLKEIPSRAFINFNKLQQIHFDHNDITTIKIDAFKGIRNLTYLGLGHNKFTVLKDAGFPNTLRIGHLAINANNLTFLSDGIFKKLTAVEINMGYNPWTCACLDRINYWLYIKNGVIKNSEGCADSNTPVCVVPKNTKSCIEQFDHDAASRYMSSIKITNNSTSCVNFQ